MAEGIGARRLSRLQADPRLEPLALLVDERYQGDRHAKQLRGQARDLIEGRLRGRIEYLEAPERGETRLFLHRRGRGGGSRLFKIAWKIHARTS